MYASRQLKPVILQHMEVIFSHTTALDFLRMWSCNHPLALRAFHDLRSRDVGHLPSSHLKGFSSLARAADTEAAVRAAEFCRGAGASLADEHRPSVYELH